MIGTDRVIGVLVSGEGTNLQALIDAGLPVAAVASNRKDAYALVARERGGHRDRDVLPRLPTRAARSATSLMATWLEEHGVELVVLAGYMHLLDEAVPRPLPRPDRQRPLRRCCPAFPGAHPIDDVLAAGVADDRRHRPLVDEGVDTGPVIAARARARRSRRHGETLVDRIHAVEHRLLPEVVSELCAR